MDLTTVTIADTTYPLAWGNLARMRYSSLPREVRELNDPVATIAMLWAAIAQKPNPFLTWEHLAELVPPSEFNRVQIELSKCLPSEPEAEKKSGSESGLLPVSDSG